ncbi:hypothetical protein TYRP_015256 [Tyrophagus putrescentiae]|nr:hypothetical protein TYRP_015256 [Tyrophagus putrescentiae]
MRTIIARENIGTTEAKMECGHWQEENHSSSNQKDEVKKAEEGDAGRVGDAEDGGSGGISSVSVSGGADSLLKTPSVEEVHPQPLHQVLGHLAADGNDGRHVEGVVEEDKAVGDIEVPDDLRVEDNVQRKGDDGAVHEEDRAQVARPEAVVVSQLGKKRHVVGVAALKGCQVVQQRNLSRCFGVCVIFNVLSPSYCHLLQERMRHQVGETASAALRQRPLLNLNVPRRQIKGQKEAVEAAAADRCPSEGRSVIRKRASHLKCSRFEGQNSPEEDRQQNGPEENRALAVDRILAPVLHQKQNSLQLGRGSDWQEENGRASNQKDEVKEAEKGDAGRVGDAGEDGGDVSGANLLLKAPSVEEVHPQPLHQVLNILQREKEVEANIGDDHLKGLVGDLRPIGEGKAGGAQRADRLTDRLQADHLSRGEHAHPGHPDQLRRTSRTAVRPLLLLPGHLAADRDDGTDAEGVVNEDRPVGDPEVPGDTPIEDNVQRKGDDGAVHEEDGAQLGKQMLIVGVSPLKGRQMVENGKVVAGN